MTTSAALRSGKGAGDENFPVASRLVAPRHRAAILAFYEFVRVADDIADHASLPAPDKLARLDRLEETLLGGDDTEPEGVRLRSVLRERGLSPVHAQHLLRAFRQDVTKLRYEDWDDLIDYCRYSAMPVGRFVLDVHGEPQSTWAANDALCAALQIINHLQDCGKDYRELDRVYVPRDALAAQGITVEALAEKRAGPALLRALRDIAARTSVLLAESRAFSAQIADRRLAMEVAAIQALAERLIGLLLTRDPLSERVHLSKPRMLVVGLSGAAGALVRRAIARAAPSSAFARRPAR
jgi:squalene synthase HpnC